MVNLLQRTRGVRMFCRAPAIQVICIVAHSRSLFKCLNSFLGLQEARILEVVAAQGEQTDIYAKQRRSRNWMSNKECVAFL